MSDVENVCAEKCNSPNSPSEPTEKIHQNETISLKAQNTLDCANKHADPTSEDGKLFACMDSELDFEEAPLSSPEKPPEHQAPQTEPNEAHTHGFEDGEDDGECSDDEDLEEGELKDEENEKAVKKPICRFFNRGLCFYGVQCRFLHCPPHIGNYKMFSPTPRYDLAHIGNMVPLPAPNPHGFIHRSAPRSGPDFMPVPLLPAPVEQPESAWEKGLREAKELLKKASQRKEEPDFEEKRLNLTVTNDRNHQQGINEKDKENDKFFGYKKNREELYKYGDPAYNRSHFGSRYENFEIRYSNVDRGRSRRRAHGDRRFNTGHWRNDRIEDPLERGEFYFDPWRRSKSPKHRRSKDRETSRGSPFSSVSQSYSSRSSSYSRSSSSMSRGLSSRSPSPVSEKKNPAKNLYPLSPPNLNKLNAIKGKKKHPSPPGAHTKKRTFSSSRSPSRSSQSSRSLSMDSVSSASSSVSHTSSGESSGRPEHVSILRRQDEREKPAVKEPEREVPTTGFYFQIPRPFKRETEIGLPDDRDPLDESFHTSSSPTMQHLMPAERAKDPVKGLHPPKQQIKLTLLNKNPQSKLSNLPCKGEEVPKVGGLLHGVKRPLSPPVPPAVMKPQPAVPKKSASSRRDELLKQLKAVEDAIARKRAKFC